VASVDHRRGIADRNRSAIVDAAERLLAERRPLNMAAVAAEAGVSRPTLYSHFKTLADLLETAVARAVDESMAAIREAELDARPPDEVVERMIETSWSKLAGIEALVHGAAEHLSVDHVHRTHAPLMEMTARVIERGQSEGVFRTDLPSVWLVTAYYALIHAADEVVRSGRMKRGQALDMLKATIRDLLTPRG
jgi:AcrR family transcriptional regulator